MSKAYIKIISLFLILIPGLFNRLFAQDTVIIKHDIAVLDSIQSTVLKEKRLIQIFLPEDYKADSAKKYDVLYVLDGGNWNTGLINKVQQFLEGERYMPPTIIVSILGIDRDKDLTPTKLKDWKTSGGATNFLSFITSELIPYINKKYPSNGDNTLWGHSLGGLFVMNALLNEPKAFKSYIAVDPSLWWDNAYIQKQASSRLPLLRGINTTLYISGREGKAGETMKIDTMDEVLKNLAPASLKWKSVRYADETHSSVRLKTIYDGLKFSYGWHNNHIEFHPMNGIIAKSKPFTIWYFGDTTRVNYTLNGTSPTAQSPEIKSEIVLTDAAKLTVKEFTNRARYDQVKTGDFITVKQTPPLAKAGKAQPGGFHYAYYEYNGDKEIDKKQKPQKEGIINADFNIDKLPRKNNYLLIIDGWLQSTEEGYYLFILNADNGSKLYINNRMLMQWEGSYADPSYSYMLPLQKGFYPFRLEYRHKHEDFKLNLTYLTPSTMAAKNPVDIPLDKQFSRK